MAAAASAVCRDRTHTSIVSYFRVSRGQARGERAAGVGAAQEALRTLESRSVELARGWLRGRRRAVRARASTDVIVCCHISARMENKTHAVCEYDGELYACLGW